MPYTLAFDVYGTLINTSGVFESLQKLIGPKALAFMNTWRDKQLEYSFRRSAMNKYVDFSICTKAALVYACKLHSVDMSEDQQQSLMKEYTVLPAFPDVAASLIGLKEAGHTVYAFSNGSKSALLKLFTHAQLIDLFDGIISVEGIQVFKPSPKVYAYFNTQTQSNKEKSWLISGNPFDVLGAAAYGMHTAWVKRSELAIFDTWEHSPSVVIGSLLELKDALHKE